MNGEKSGEDVTELKLEEILKLYERATTEGLIRVFLQVRVGAAPLATPSPRCVLKARFEED